METTSTDISDKRATRPTGAISEGGRHEDVGPQAIPEAYDKAGAAVCGTPASDLEQKLEYAERSLLCAERIDNFARMERETAYWRGRVAEIKRQIADEAAYVRNAVDALGDRHAS